MIFDDLKGLLQGSGLTGSYQFRSIWLPSMESSNNADQRFIVMRRSGGGSDKFTRTFNYQVQLFGKINDTGIAGLESDADGLINYVKDEIDFNCIVGTNITGDVAGVYFTDSNRPFFVFNLEVIYNG